eukprot:TRINITY_DN23881_c0_g1_i2.p1 TRINITY_DN23881_c0_g1~~TRINITY_DN23881_c0_g1_i2.p1  ORF type:complete len:344 (+),score=57.85 TRINITY_DN23881_c0_g1_i2:38-1033(+)
MLSWHAASTLHSVWTSPSIQWTVTKNSNGILLLSNVLLLVSLATLTRHDVEGTRSACYMLLAVLQGVCILLFKVLNSPALKGLIFVIGCCLASAGRFALVLVEREELVLFKLALQSVLLKPLPCLLGFPLKLSVPYMSFTSFSVLVVHFQLWHSRGTEICSEALHGELLILVASCVFAIIQQHGLLSLISLQKSAEAEKRSLHSLLKLTCDAVLWVAQDGSTVLRSDLGVLQFMPSGIREHPRNFSFLDMFRGAERKRIEGIVANFLSSAASVDRPTPSEMLHTTISTDTDDKPVDIFLVEQHDTLMPFKTRPTIFKPSVLTHSMYLRLTS